MSHLIREVSIPCVDRDGRTLAFIKVVDSGISPSILILGEEEANQCGEEAIQLLEGYRYDFELTGNRENLEVQPSGLVKPNAIRNTLGRIETGIETGLLQITIEDKRTRMPIAIASLEIRSNKIDYRSDYRGMLNHIASQCGELLFDVRATAKMRLLPTAKLESDNLQRRLEFLTATIQSREFFVALHQIMSSPHQTLKRNDEEVPIGRTRRTGRDLSRQIATSSSRTCLPQNHPLKLRIAINSVPSHVIVAKRVESRDTPENRFVKHVLTSFREFLQRATSVFRHSRTEGRRRLQRNLQFLSAKIDEALSHQFFQDVSALTVLPLGSPVLHRKSGYREFLLTWLKFELAAELAWVGGRDVYGAGKRDMAALYEYWVFFQLLRLFRDKFVLDAPAAQSLFESSDGGLNLKLKTNRATRISGRCIRRSRRLRVLYNYNQTFDCSDERTSAGSWTRRMRPDFTLTFWPEEFTLEEAEAQELAVHLHFDAKYRVETITEIFGNADDDPAEEKIDQKRGTYRRGDLLKMHAYRDAIKRSEGAYVIYPGGDRAPTSFQGFHEILPGLGAFAVKPGASGEGIGLSHLSRFIDDAITHVCNRATAREQNSFNRFYVYRESATMSQMDIGRPIPERDSITSIRTPPPIEQTVLIGWYENQEHLDWIANSGLYNFRAGHRNGSIRLAPEIVQAEYLLLHTHNHASASGLWRIQKRGPRLFTNAELRKRGYPRESTSDAIYAVFDVSPDPFFVGWSWNYSNLPGRKTGRNSAEPFAVRLVDVLAIGME
ncbi:MAG: DUF2357 domain-containing protein [Planctomycetaceae bacterium]